jgi:hypothetical protein
MRLVRAQLFCEERRRDGRTVRQTDRQTGMTFRTVVYGRRLAKALENSFAVQLRF